MKCTKLGIFRGLTEGTVGRAVLFKPCGFKAGVFGLDVHRVWGLISLQNVQKSCMVDMAGIACLDRGFFSLTFHSFCIS